MPIKAPKITPFHAPRYGGWTPEKKAILEAVQIPDKTRCCDCGKLQKTKTAFSEKQQNDLRHGMASGQIKAGREKGEWIRCRFCVGQQNTEMMCVICEQYKSLDGFAKAQRRTPDTARCMACIAEVQETTPYDKSAAEHHRDESDEENDDDNSDTETNPYSLSTNYTDDGDSESGVRIFGQVLNDENLQTLHASIRGNSTQPSRANVSTSASVTSNKTPWPGVAKWQAMSRGNDAATEEASNSRSQYASDVVQPKKFAKVPVIPWKAPLPEYKGGRTIQAHDSDDDDDEDDEDDYFTI